MYTGKFKKGDKVRFVTNKYPEFVRRNEFMGKVLTIEGTYKHEWEKEISGYSVEEVEPYFFREEELELVASAAKKRTAEIRFCIDPENKKDAHRIAHEAVDSAIELYEKKKGEEWTPAELVTAKYLFAEFIDDFIKKFDGNYFRFDVNPVLKSVSLVIAESKFIPVLGGGEAPAFKTMKVYHAYPQNNDQFNEKIGKIVCVCKALGRPIPVFIRDKNRRIEGDWIL